MPATLRSSEGPRVAPVDPRLQPAGLAPSSEDALVERPDRDTRQSGADHGEPPQAWRLEGARALRIQLRRRGEWSIVARDAARARGAQPAEHRLADNECADPSRAVSAPAVEIVALDEAVQTLARTVSHELSQPLTVLMGLLDLWERDYFEGCRAPTLRVELADVVRELAVRIEAFSRAERYVTREFGGSRLLDLPRAQPRPLRQ